MTSSNLSSGSDDNQNNDANNKITKTDAEWLEQLGESAFYVTRKAGTERPFTGEYTDCDIAGVYHCVCCDAPLFSSTAKFQSHCGWPSFNQVAANSEVDEHQDHSHGMVRTEVTCHRCDAHLGHVFPDGPAPTGLRYCINSVAIVLKKKSKFKVD